MDTTDVQGSCVISASPRALEIPDTDVSSDYTVDQRNAEGIMGANWNTPRRWSLMVQINGVFGSLDSIFAALGWRFWASRGLRFL